MCRNFLFFIYKCVEDLPKTPPQFKQLGITPPEKRVLLIFLWIMKLSEFKKSRGSSGTKLELTPTEITDIDEERQMLTFQDQNGKEYNFRSPNYDDAVDAGLVTENGDHYVEVPKNVVFRLNGWDNFRIKSAPTPDEIKKR